MKRNLFLQLCAASALAGLAGMAAAQTAPVWPAAKPVRVVVAFTAGGTTDILARQVTQQLGEKLKQQFVIDNKPGAGGNLGTELVVRAAPDGYTLIVNSVGPIAVNPSLYRALPYNPLTDLVPMVQIADVPNVLVVHPSVPARSMEEFLAYAKANPGVLNYGSTGIGTSSHLSSFMLAKRAGFEATHIAYKGADALRDLLAGRIQFMFATIPSVMPHITAGKLRPIAVSSLQRSRSMPDVPTVAAAGFPGFEATHIAYKGADALRDLLAGRIQFMFATIPSVMPHITAGKLRPIAVSSLQRSRSMPDVPTVAAAGFPGFEAGSWFGFFAPKGTPQAVIDQINRAVNEVIKVPAVEQQMIAQGADPVGGTPEQFGQFVQREYEKWKLIVQESGARAE